MFLFVMKYNNIAYKTIYVVYWGFFVFFMINDDGGGAV